METKSAQLRIMGRNAITSYGSSGTIFYETPARARFLIDNGIAELVNVESAKIKPVGPVETKPAGPSEPKPAGPLEKKEFCEGARDGPSTDSPSLNEVGRESQSASLGADQASRRAIAPPSRRPGRPRRST